MTSHLKKSVQILEDISNGHYATACVKLNHSDIISKLYEISTIDSKDISVKDVLFLKNIIQISRSLFELNQYMSGVLYKLIPDNIYDVIIEKYKSLNSDDEPFQSFIPNGMRSAEQDFPELSGTLDKAYDVYDVSDKPSVEKWLKKIFKELDVKKLSLMVSSKFDGTSVTITSDRDKNLINPSKALTRGDFENNLGVDLSNILIGRTGKFLNDALSKSIPDKIGIQYEAMITEYGKEKLSKIVSTAYSTRRAAIASALKRISNSKTSSDELKEINKCVTLVPIMIDSNFIKSFHGKLTPYELLGHVSKLFYYGDEKNSLEYEIHEISGSQKELLEKFDNIVNEYVEKRNNLNYSIDGLVLSINDHNHIKYIGRSSNKNKWQIAFKFNALVQRTKITGMISTMGKQSYIGHNITFEPIEFNGVRYDKAPVNNIGRFNDLDPHIGDEVLVSYNGDVMGYIYKDASCKKNRNGVKLELPENCIECESELVIEKDMLKCTNPECPGYKVGAISEAIRILNLDHFGDETAIAIVKIANITNAIEFINMPYEDLAKVLKGLNLEKAWSEFKNKINAPISYAKILDFLRIPGLRNKTAENILNNIKVAELLGLVETGNKEKLLEKLKSMKGIDKKAKLFADGLINSKETLFELINLLNCKEEEKKEYDKTILISGFRNNKEFINKCELLSYKIIESGSKFDALVVTPDRITGKKAIAARKKGIPVILLSDFINKNEILDL